MPERSDDCAPMIDAERSSSRGGSANRLSLIFDDQFCVGLDGHSFFDGVAGP